MHPEATGYLKRMKALHPEIFKGKILECGSYDVNGNPRGFFEATEYVGLDWRPGPGVDRVSLIHEYEGHPDGYFDTAVSMETFEHDPYWKASLERMIHLVRKGGAILVTCAGPGRFIHCTETSPTAYYANISLDELLRVTMAYARSVTMVEGEYDPMACDTRLLLKREG